MHELSRRFTFEVHLEIIIQCYLKIEKFSLCKMTIKYILKLIEVY